MFKKKEEENALRTVLKLNSKIVKTSINILTSIKKSRNYGCTVLWYQDALDRWLLLTRGSYWTSGS
jgi:hypothetical protein